MGSERVEGMSKLSTALKELPKNIARNVLRGMVSSGAAVVRNEAKVRAPRAEAAIIRNKKLGLVTLPGTLMRAIFMKRKKGSDENRAIYEVFVRTGHMKGVKAYGKTDAFYWRWVEFGTSRMQGHAFMRPAFEAKKHEAVEAMADYGRAKIPEEVAKLK